MKEHWILWESEILHELFLYDWIYEFKIILWLDRVEKENKNVS
jgi:hypothetical protein